MDTKTALWFCIERTFARVFELCLEARAAELIVQQKAAEGGLLRGLSGETSVLPAVTDSNAAERDERAVELARSPAFRESHENGADVVALRSELRRVLGELRAKLHEVLTEHEVYYVLFPIVVYCDELVATATRGAVTRWEPMQGEFYEIENGGELFYEVLEERLRQDETHPLVFETFYFCLLDGFTGMYPAGSKKIDEYKERLVARFRPPPIRFPRIEVERKRAELVPFPRRYYASAAAVVLAVYCVLSWMAG
ncbi:MAG TPA: DotU family type IV/VI secretion system protein [Polyangiaceae bacterium]|nr:DotU family type IV/VI secretion system protein [Polyangiaceae bacterium]